MNAEKPSNPMRRIVMPTLFVIAVLMGLFLWVLSGTGIGSVQGAAKSTVVMQNHDNLMGTWHQIPDGNAGITMTADVYTDSIQINISVNGTGGIYWLGSFDPSVISGTILSQGDSDAMADAIFASQDSTKLFTYANGVLTYQFSMLGVTSTVSLTREAQS